MGLAVLAAAAADPDVVVAAQIDAGDALAPALAACDAVIDFSHHSFTAELSAACAVAGKHLVIGTTGHTAEEKVAIIVTGARSRRTSASASALPGSP